MSVGGLPVVCLSAYYEYERLMPGTNIPPRSIDMVKQNFMYMNLLVLGVTSVDLIYCRHTPWGRFEELFQVVQSDKSLNLEDNFLDTFLCHFNMTFVSS